MKLRLQLADRLRCALSDLDDWTVSEFNLVVAGYADRALTE